MTNCVTKLASSRRLLHYCYLLFLVTSFQTNVNAFAINNEITGQPQVHCAEDAVTLSVRTRNVFQGNIFVKGKYAIPQCRQEYYANQANVASFTVRIGECGMLRQRQLQPHGMNYMLVFVVSFHQQFITKVDRAYNVRCFYQQAEKTVTSQLEVSMLPTQELLDTTMLMPNCEYSIRAGTINGPRVRYAQVGDRLIHRWECDNPNFGMLVKNCFVNDGQGSSVRVLDARGCPVFTPVIQGAPDYDPSLTVATVEVWAYKFPDRNDLYFQCQIQVCNKRENECLGVTPPNCPYVLKPDFTGQAFGGAVTDSLGRTIVNIPGFLTTPLQPLLPIQPQPFQPAPGSGYGSQPILLGPGSGGYGGIPEGYPLPISGGTNIQGGFPVPVPAGQELYPPYGPLNPEEPLLFTPAPYPPPPAQLPLGIPNLPVARPYEAKDEPTFNRDAVVQRFEAQIIDKPVNISNFTSNTFGLDQLSSLQQSGIRNQRQKSRRSPDKLSALSNDLKTLNSNEVEVTTISYSIQKETETRPSHAEDTVDVATDVVFVVDVEDSHETKDHARGASSRFVSVQQTSADGQSFTCFNSTGLALMSTCFVALLTLILFLLSYALQLRSRRKLAVSDKVTSCFQYILTHVLRRRS